MSRRTPIQELIAEENVTDSPRRRSTRIAAVVTRRASASEETTATPAKITRSKRLSLSQENAAKDDNDDNDDKASVSSMSSSHGRTTPKLQIATRAASKSPQTKAKASEISDGPAKRTRRRGSTSSLAEEEERAPSPAPIRLTRRSSANFRSTSPTNEPVITTKAATPRKSSRASESPTPEVSSTSKPIRGRRSSVTEKIVPLESIEETETKEAEAIEIEVEIYNSESEITDDKDESTAGKKKKAVVKKQNLQTIAESSFVEESQEPFAETETQVPDEKEPTDKNSEVNEKESSKQGDDLPVLQETKPKYRLSLLKTQDDDVEESEEEKELKLVLHSEVDENSSPRRSPRKSINLPAPEKRPLTPSKQKSTPSKTELNKSTEIGKIKAVYESGSDDSFRINLHISESDTSRENLELKTNEKPKLDTSGSSNASDKENQQLSKIITENKSSPKTDLTKKKWLSEFNAQMTSNNSEVKESPAKSSNEVNKSKTERSFYEPMEVDEYPSDAEMNLQIDEVAEKVSNVSLPKENNASLIEESPKPADELSEKMQSPSLLRKSFGTLDTSKTKSSPVDQKQEESKSPQTSLNTSETKILEAEKPTVPSVTSESPKVSSPIRRSARLLKTSHSESPVSEQDSIVNSTPKPKQLDESNTNSEVSCENNTSPVKVALFDSDKKQESKSGEELKDETDVSENLDKNQSLAEELPSEKLVEDSAETESAKDRSLTDSFKNVSELKECDGEDDKNKDASQGEAIDKTEASEKIVEKRTSLIEVQETDLKDKNTKNKDDSNVELPEKGKSNRSKLNLSESSSKSEKQKKKRKSKKLSDSVMFSDEEGDDLSQKINQLIADQLPDETSSDESVVDYLDDMAEEGEEDTPSEGSNDIIDIGESIGSSESEMDSDESYEHDSFIDDEEGHELLSGDEYDLDQEKNPKKKRRSRIIELEDSEDEKEETKNVSLSTKPTPAKDDKPAPVEKPEKMRNGIEEDSDLEKMSTQPYCGLTPPSVVSLRESLSDDDDKVIVLKEDEEQSDVSVLINKEDNLKSLEELKQQRSSNEFDKSNQKDLSEVKTPQKDTSIVVVSTPNNSILEIDADKSEKANRKRLSSLTIQENISLKNIEEGNISDHILKVVDVFCLSVKKDGKETSGNISLNISLNYSQSPLPTDNEEDAEPEESNKQDKKKRKSIEVSKATQALQNVLEEHLQKKRLSQEHSEGKTVEKEKPKDVLEISTCSSNVSLTKLPNQSSAKKRNKKQLASSYEEINEKLSPAVDINLSTSNKKKKKKQKIALEIDYSSDSAMSDDLDKELFKKYDFGQKSDEALKFVLDNTSEETAAMTTNKSKKRKKSKSADNQVSGLVEVKTDVNEFSEGSETEFKKDAQTFDVDTSVTKSKKKKHKKQTKKAKKSDVADIIVETVVSKKSKSKLVHAENIVTPYPTKGKQRMLEVPSEKLAFKPEKLNVNYFPSSVLQQLTKGQKQKNRDVPKLVTSTSNVIKKPKRPKLVPSLSMGKRSWDSDFVDSLKPSMSGTTSKSKKMKTSHVDNFPKNDFKNRMLYDSTRVERIDTKTLLKKKQKIKS